MQAIVNSAAPFIDMEAHQNISFEDGVLDNDEDYLIVQKQLLQIIHTNNLSWGLHGSPLYILRPSYDYEESEELQFIAFSHSQDDKYIGHVITVEDHLRQALQGTPSSSGLYQDKDGIWISAAHPLYDSNNNVVAVLQADHNVSIFVEEAVIIVFRLIAGAGFAVILTAAISLIFIRRITFPLRVLKGALNDFSEGDLSRRISVKSYHGEVGYLLSSYNSMAEQIQHEIYFSEQQRGHLEDLSQELSKANLHLEDMVIARTSSLSDSNIHLIKTLKELELSKEQLILSEKMASIGRLSAGVAHEINNPLSYVTSNIHFVEGYVKSFLDVLTAIEQSKHLEPLPSNVADAYSRLIKKHELSYIASETKEAIKDTLVGMDRIKDIVTGLMAFSHTTEVAVVSVSVNGCIEYALKVAHIALKNRCVVTKDLSETPNIACKSGVLNQVFLNLIINASQAIDERGTIHIKSSLVDNSIVVSIRDSGKGMNKDQLTKIFDPFYTTKDVGVGTGLGLYISYNIIQALGGFISVDSSMGKGCCFTITIPIR